MSHYMYRRWLMPVVVTSALLGAGAYGLGILSGGWGLSVWQVVLIAYLVPLVWNFILFDCIIPAPYGGLGYLFPDTMKVYNLSLLYACIATIPSLAVSFALLVAAGHAGLGYLWYL